MPSVARLGLSGGLCCLGWSQEAEGPRPPARGSRVWGEVRPRLQPPRRPLRLRQPPAPQEEGARAEASLGGPREAESEEAGSGRRRVQRAESERRRPLLAGAGKDTP